MKNIEVAAKTVNEAIQKALAELNVTKDEVNIEVIEEGSKGFLNMFGVKPAKIKVTLIEKKFNEVVEEKVIETKSTTVKEVKKDESILNTNSQRDYVSQAKTFLRDILDSMDIMAEVRIREEDDVLYIDLTGPKMGLIIGYRGETLDSLQYLVSLVVNKGHDIPYKKIVLDTENYRTKREETLKRVALKTASKVKRMGRPYKLEPMNPYERRIIHSALQSETGIITYSEGEEPYRRIIIDIKR